jgi:protein SCO1/2
MVASTLLLALPARHPVAVARAMPADGAARSAAVAPVHALPQPTVRPTMLYAIDAPLETAEGTRTTLAALAGAPRLATMFYAHCASSCPLAIGALQRLQATLATDARHAPAVLLLSLDPQRDTPAALAEFRRGIGAPAAAWTLARSGTATTQLARWFGIAPRSLADGTIDHGAVILMLDANGREVARTSDLSGGDAAFVAAASRAMDDAAASRAINDAAASRALATTQQP